MTKINISPDAVERLAAAIEPHPGYGMCRACDEYQAVDEHAQAAATLRALAAENARMKAALERIKAGCEAQRRGEIGPLGWMAEATAALAGETP